jgi:hypothetical protein
MKPGFFAFKSYNLLYLNDIYDIRRIPSAKVDYWTKPVFLLYFKVL